MSVSKPHSNRERKPRLERLNLFRRPIGGDDQLAARFVQRVERVEELFLRRLLAGKELNVVDEQHVDLAVAIAELAAFDCFAAR